MNSAWDRIEELMGRGMFDAAASICRELLERDPRQAAVWAYLGAIAMQAKEFGEAATAFRHAVDINAADANSWHHLSIALHEQGQFTEAEQCSQQALAINASQAAFWIHLGNVQFACKCFDRAASAYQQAVKLDPFNPTAWNGLGAAEHVRERPAEAKAAYESSLALDPRQVETLLKMAVLLERQGSLCEAETYTRRALSIDPQRADAWSLVGRVELSLCQQPEAANAFRRALALRPDPDAHSQLLHCLQYSADITPQALLVAHREWDAAYAKIRPPSCPNKRQRRASGQPLRIGFVSADFGINPIGFLALPVLEHLDKAACSIACYFDRPREDALTSRFRASSDVWRVTHDLSRDELARQIREDEIDVLVDLMGHLGNRLVVFASKPAPVQVTWLGYVGTTGLAAIDFLLADRFHVQPGEEAAYAETVLRMPSGYACYGPPDYAPDVAPLPALSSDHFTFGCFNNPAKYSAKALDAFCEVLRRVPRAQLLLKYGGLQEAASQNRWRSEFSRRGVEPERILLEGWSPHHELLTGYHRVDLALDTQPYSGGLTTCEALWMGVPVITCPGLTFAGRHSTSHLTTAGYQAFVARNIGEYVELAAGWPNRLDELSAIRSTMRERVRASPLCNVRLFAGDFLKVLQRAWDAAPTTK
jgi:protein O-GlcNAc transferase